MRWVSALLCGILLALACGAASATPRRCGGDGEDAICYLPFGDLWARSEQYDGRTVILNGFLVSGFGRLILYPGFDYFFFQRGIGGISIEMDHAGFEAARAEMRKVAEEDMSDWEYFAPCPVSVVGVFRDGSVADFGSMGRIEAGGTRLNIESDGADCPMSDPATKLKMPGGRPPKPKDWDQ